MFLRTKDHEDGGEIELSRTTLIRMSTSGRVLVIRANPKSPNSTILECTIYARHDGRDFIELEVLKSNLQSEIEELAARQRSLRWNQSFSSSDLSIAKQNDINMHLKLHLEEEKKAGVEIEPAAQARSLSREGKADDECGYLRHKHISIISDVSAVCKELDNAGQSVCSANSKGLLDW